MLEPESYGVVWLVEAISPISEDREVGAEAWHFFLIFIFITCIRVHGYVGVRAFECSIYGDQKRGLDLLVLELQALVSNLKCMLGADFRSSAGAAHDPSYQALSSGRPSFSTQPYGEHHMFHQQISPL